MTVAAMMVCIPASGTIRNGEHLRFRTGDTADSGPVFNEQDNSRKNSVKFSFSTLTEENAGQKTLPPEGSTPLPVPDTDTGGITRKKCTICLHLNAGPEIHERDTISGPGADESFSPVSP